MRGLSGRVWMVGILVVCVTGCSYSSRRAQAYLLAESLPELQIPADLADTTTMAQLYPIPAGEYNTTVAGQPDLFPPRLDIDELVEEHGVVGEDEVIESYELVEEGSVIESYEVIEEDGLVETYAVIEEDSVIDSYEVIEEDGVVDSYEVIEEDGVVESYAVIEEDSVVETYEVIDGDEVLIIE